MCKTKVGLLTEEEKEAIEGNRYAKGKYFTPVQDEDGNWVLPLEQINKNKNIDFWWVRHLNKIDYKPKQMDKSVIPDIAALSGLLLFTGAEVSIEGAIFEIISKFGVVAVLWFWLKEMKEQMKEQSKDFYAETEKLRNEHKNTMHEFQEIHKEHKELLTKQLENKDDIIKLLQNKIKG
jgi:hypothetical protein